VCYDVFSKIRELAGTGDHRAISLLTKIERYQQEIAENNEQGLKSALQFERQIISTALDLEIIDRHASVDLRRLQDDRNRAAHPNFERYEIPHSFSAEHARLHLRIAVDHLLSQPPVQGRAALEQLKALALSQTMPANTLDAIIWFNATPIAKGSDALVRGFVDYLLYELVPLLPVRGATFLDALVQVRPGIAETRLREQISKLCRTALDEQFPKYAYLSVRLPQAWSALGEAERNRVKQLIQTGSTNGDLLGAASRHQPDLRFWVEVRLRNMSRLELKELTWYEDLKPLIAEIASDLYAQSKSWGEANVIANDLLLPVFPFVRKEQILSFIKASTIDGCDILGSHSFPVILKNAIRHKLISPGELSNELEIAKIDKVLRLGDLSTAIDDLPF